MFANRNCIAPAPQRPYKNKKVYMMDASSDTTHEFKC